MPPLMQALWNKANRGGAAAPRMDFGVIDERIQLLFELVTDGIATATVAFLSGDRTAAAALISSDCDIDALQRDVERLLEHELLRHASCTPEDLVTMLTALRIVPELERSGDLVEHIALRTGAALHASLSPRALVLIEKMGQRASEMWEVAAAAYRTRDAGAAEQLRDADDDLDDLHVSLTAELSSGSLPVSVAIELGLVARFFERLGDHAVNVTRRIAKSAPAPSRSLPRLSQLVR